MEVKIMTQRNINNIKEQVMKSKLRDLGGLITLLVEEINDCKLDPEYRNDSLKELSELENEITELCKKHHIV
jgi:hypothetical protein